MNNSKKGNFYFGISEKKIYICFFENDKSYCKENINFEIPDNLDNDLNFEILKNLLKTNIRKIEKRLGFFLNSGKIYQFNLSHIKVFCLALKIFLMKNN